MKGYTNSAVISESFEERPTSKRQSWFEKKLGSCYCYLVDTVEKSRNIIGILLVS